MIPWRLFPYLRPCLALIAGILVREFLTSEMWVVIFCMTVAIVLVATNDFIYTSSLRYPFFAGSLILILFFGLGFLSHHLHSSNPVNSHYGNFIQHGRENCVIGIIQEYPNRHKNYRTTLEVEYICNENRCFKSRNQLQLSFDSNGIKASHLSPGDRICASGMVRPVTRNTNPGTFDFAKYLRRQKITHQLYVNEEVYVLASQKLGFFRQSAMNLRNCCLGVFEKYLSGDPLAIAKAMILGFRQDVDAELYQSFSASGSMHILAVSGMHLAIIAEILLKTMDKLTFRRQKSGIFSSCLIISLLWFFSFMTGAESAIIRSVLMFTLILYGKTLQHHHSTYNIMAFCAAIMLIYQPAQLFNAGFLFSYLALLSLMYFQPIIQAWWQPLDKFSNWMWQYISASIAAQLLVGPLTVFLFHQFPLYFILSGFIPVWLSALSLKFGLLLLATEFIYAPANAWLSHGLDFLLTYFIRSVQWVESLPYACLENTYLSIPEFIFYSLAAFCLMVYTKFRTMSQLMAIMACIGLGLVWRMGSSWAHNHQVLITVYDHKKVQLIDVFVGHRCFSYGDSIQLAPYGNYLYAGHRALHFIDEVYYAGASPTTYSLGKVQVDGSGIRVGDISIARVRSLKDFNLSFTPSMYLVQGKIWPPPFALPSKIPIVLNAGIRGEMLHKWHETAAKYDLNLHSVYEKGALILKPPFKIIENEI